MNSLQWLQFLVSYLVQASLVICTSWGLERWSTASKTKTRIWSACYVSLTGLFVAGLMLPRLEIVHPWSSLGPRELLDVASAEHVIGKSLLAAWIFGSCVMLVRWVMQFFAVRAFLRRCPEYPGETQLRLRSLISTELPMPHDDALSFRQCPEELGPFCYQFHRPIVFLPMSLVRRDEIELEHVLRHELTHLMTQHPLQLFAQKVAQVILWFHPLVWMSGRRANLVREFVCDDAASGDSESTASYLRTLLRLVEYRSSSPSGALSLGRGQSELRLRAQRLVLTRQANRSPRAKWAPFGVCMVALGASQLWLPTNPLASPQASHSPWPHWTASTLHAFGVSVRDFDRFDGQIRIHELMENYEGSAMDD